jgi:hypothetical protein
MTTASATTEWTCGRCEVTVRFMPDAERVGLPTHWVEQDGEAYCLACRRAIAVDEAIEAAGEASGESLAKLRTAALVEFEIKRDPDRANGEIARACRSSVPAVVKARQRLS